MQLLQVAVQDGLRLVFQIAEAAAVVFFDGGRAAVVDDRLQLEPPEGPWPRPVSLYVRPNVGLLVEGLAAHH